MQGLIRDDNETFEYFETHVRAFKRGLIRISHWRLIPIIMLKIWNF